MTINLAAIEKRNEEQSATLRSLYLIVASRVDIHDLRSAIAIANLAIAENAALVAEVVSLRTLLNQVSAGIYKNGSGDRRLGAYVNGVWFAMSDVDDGDATLIDDWRLRRDAALTPTTSE